MSELTAPIDYWSYSAMNALLRNPLNFKKQYINKIRDNLSSPSAVVGSAAHKAVEAHLNGKSMPEAIEVGHRYIDKQSPSGIKWGKTGTPEKIIKDYNQVIDSYFSEFVMPHETLGVEYETVVDAKTRDGKDMPLPIKAVMDVVTRNRYGEIEVIDHKFVSSYSDGDTDDFPHLLQAMFYWHAVTAKFGESPKRVIFNECKVSKNKDGSPQLQPYTIEFSEHSHDFIMFYNLYRDCTLFITRPDAMYLPNPNDIFDGDNSFEVYRSGIIGAEAAVPVRHKTQQADYVEAKFVPSAFDTPQGVNLTPEERIRLKLTELNLRVEMADTHVGPTVTRYTMKPARGMRMAAFGKIADDIALALSAKSVRVEAPIRGTNLVGIEVANQVRKRVDLSESHYEKGELSIPVGVSVDGEIIHCQLHDAPHLLIAGATGAGKSVMLNVALKALTAQLPPERLELMLIDPKRVELSHFANDPHLIMPVVYETDEAVELLQYAVDQMEARYKLLAQEGARSIRDYAGNMPYMVIVIDEFADLMMTGKDDTAERLIIRIAQKARAVGIHLILATQRPSADVVTGLIKANVPTKICFMTTSKVNSQIVLDTPGAEELTGKGDMLYLDPGYNGLRRLQGFYA